MKSSFSVLRNAVNQYVNNCNKLFYDRPYYQLELVENTKLLEIEIYNKGDFTLYDAYDLMKIADALGYTKYVTVKKIKEEHKAVLIISN